jgi:hypothetical protein
MKNNPHTPLQSASEVQGIYRHWGIELHGLTTQNYTTPQEYLRLLEAIEQVVPARPCRVFPSSFDPQDPHQRSVPRPLFSRWESCEETLRTFGSRGVILRLPLFWQVEAPLHHACTAAKATLFVNDPGNMPVGAEAVRSAGLDTVLTDTEDAGRFASYLLNESRVLPPRWILIHRPDHAWVVPAALDAADRVAQEVHLFPGVPFLYQCPALIEKREPIFHSGGQYHIQIEEGETHITNREEFSLPLWRYRLPRTLAHAGTCSCGRVRYAQQTHHA